MMEQAIEIRGARLHNLKGVDVDIPKNRLVVITGVSGSGKSSLALDTLHQESMRQLFDAIGMVAMGLSKPAVASIRGLSPSISIDQYLSNRSPRSTVGTATDVFTYLRLLFARLGHRPCPHCGGDVPPAHEDDAWNEGEGDTGDGGEERVAPCPHCGAPLPVLTMAHFSFNKPEGACPDCTGLGVVHAPNAENLLQETMSIHEGGVTLWSAPERSRYADVLSAAAHHYGLRFDPDAPVARMEPAMRDLLLYGVASDRFRRHVGEVSPPATVSRGRYEGLVPNLMRRHAESAAGSSHRRKLGRLLHRQPCPACEGQRLRSESRAVSIEGQTIVALAQMPLSGLAQWLEGLKEAVAAAGEAQAIAAPVLGDLHERIHRLLDVGLGYLSCDRDTPTLSNGEEMRLRLASLLGSSLTGMLYVLDEPTIGLHPRDTARLIAVLRRLRDLGNTVLVIEHDMEMMRAADLLLDMGPGAGREGGELVACAPQQQVAAEAKTWTGRYLSGAQEMTVSSRRREGNGHRLLIEGAAANNLKEITVALPLGLFTAIVGVSGSGKSSLMVDTLGRAAARRFQGATAEPGVHRAIQGWEHLEDVVIIDQAPIGRSPRSNAATYTGVFTAIRETFAALPAARELDPRHFSFNVPGGRCERCEGAGVLAVNMHFLPAVNVRCPACGGRRYREAVLDVAFRGATIADVLEATVAEALVLFEDREAVASRLQLLADVGLEYLQLGQPATAISGGEAQRIKLAKELARRNTGRTLYLLDEPTTGQHPHNVGQLLGVLQRLVDGGNTVAVVEHNLELIQAADWLIELGPEGGDEGGYLLAEGPPETIIACGTPTAHYLAAYSQGVHLQGGTF